MNDLGPLRGGFWPDGDEVSTTVALRDAPEPLEFETAHGWLRRALRANGQPSVPPFCIQFGLNHRYLSPMTCLRIAENSEVERLDELAANTARRIGNRIEVRGEAVMGKVWSIRHRRYCPACLHESTHHRLFWDFRFYLTCPYHGVPILGDPATGRVTWAPTDLALNHDGRYLPIESPRLERPLEGLELYFVRRLSGAASHPVPLLDPYRLDEVEWTVRRLGAMLLGEPELKPHARREVLVARQAKGYEALASGRPALLEVLFEHADRQAGLLPRRAERSIAQLFGWFTDLLRARSDPLAAVVLDAMADVAERCGRRTLRGRSRPPARVPDGKLTLTEFAARLDIGTRAVRRIPGLDDVAPGPRGGASRLYFTLEELEAARAAIDTAMNAHETASALGLRAIDLAKLEQASLLRCVPKRDRVSRSKAYHRPDVAALLSRLAGFARPTVPSIGFERKVTTMRCRSGVLACLVMSGKVVPAGRGGRGRGFRALRFDAAEAGVTLQGARSKPQDPGVSASEAARRLGVSLATVRMLIEGGHLLTLGQELWRGGVCPQSLDEACARYVATDRLVHSFGCHPRSIARRLTDAGVAVLKVGRDAIGLALRSEVDALFPGHGRADDLGTMPEAERRLAGLPRVRRWRTPRIATADGGFSYTAITKRVTALLRLGETVGLTVDCSAKASQRRYRIAGLVEPVLAERLPGFVMMRDGEGHCVLRSTCPPEASDEQNQAARDQWLEAALDSLADVFTLVGTEARLRDLPRGTACKDPDC